MHEQAENSQAHAWRPEPWTWPGLLGQWVAFARQAVGLPEDDAGRRMKSSVSDIIMLQAVWFALDEVDDLPADQRALGLDRAGVLIQHHAGVLEQRWRDESMPAEMSQLLEDVRRRLHQKREDREPPAETGTMPRVIHKFPKSINTDSS